MTAAAPGSARGADPTTRAAATLFACFAAMAAALVDLSIASGYLAGSPGYLAAVPASVWGLALLGWAVTGMRKGKLVLPRPAVLALAAASAVHLIILGSGLSRQARVLDVSHLAALALTLMTVAAIGWLQRRDSALRAANSATQADAGSSGTPRTGRLLLATFAAAVVVSSVATPGLAASLAGQHAVPHGGHTGEVQDNRPNRHSGGSPHGH